MDPSEPTVALRWAELAGELAGVGYWWLDANTGSVRWSPSMYRIFGVDPQVVPTFDFAMELIHPDDRATANSNLETSLEGRAAASAVRIIRPSGEIRYVEARNTTEKAPNGDVLAAYGTVRDVTEMRAAESALRESEARYRLIAENVKDVISRAGVDGKVSYLSPAVSAVTGYEADELIGKSMAPLFHPDDRSRVLAEYRAVMTGEVQTDSLLVYRMRHKSGRWIWIAVSAAIIRDAAGNPIEFLCVTRDVSVRIELEAKLRQATEIAERAASVKSEFLANMSHEIRTPLTAILGFTSLLSERDDLHPSARTQLERVSSASEALLAIVSDVLEFSKLEAGQIEISKTPASPVTLAEDAIAMLESAAKAKNIGLFCNPKGDIPAALLLDGGRMRQVLLNLLSNAVKFTDAGTITTTIAYDMQANRLHIEVEDTGQGLSAEQQAKLFLRFSQVDGSSTRRHGGAGLGLAICKGLVEAMGGSIGVRSQPGCGATFFFDVSASVAEQAKAAAPRSKASTLHGKRVLVVDDHPTIRELIRTILAAAGAEVAEAGDGVAGVQEAAGRRFDAILMDLFMPRQDGHSAAYEVRNGEGPNQSTPIIAFSAHAEVANVDSEIFCSWIAKPVMPAELLTVLIQSISGAAHGFNEANEAGPRG